MPYEIFGWILTKDVECSWCGKPAVFYVTRNGIDQAAVCRTCTPEDATDRVAEVFIEVMRQPEPKQPK